MFLPSVPLRLSPLHTGLLSAVPTSQCSILPRTPLLWMTRTERSK